MRPLLASIALLLAAVAAPAQRFYPMITAVRPVAVQAGKTAECEFEAVHDLRGADRVFVTGDGVTGEVVPPPEFKGKGQPPALNRIKVRFKAAADALAGMRDVRLITPRGASTLGQVVIVRDPVVSEAGDNNTLKAAQAITLPAAVCGAIERAEDVDFFKFTVKANTALTFHAHCHRLADRIHDFQILPDPILVVRDAAGKVLASNDNHYAADPLLHFKFTKEGEYFLEVRDVRFQGNPQWVYCIEINDRPFVTHTLPVRLAPGKTTKLKLDGFNLPAKEAEITLHANEAEGVRRYALKLGKDVTSNPVPFVVDKLPEVREEAGDNDTPAKAQKATVPCGISGCMDAENDADCYSFEAKKGEKFTFTVLAQRAGSRLDSFLRVLGPKGERLIENDDHQERTSSYSGFNYTSDSRVENWAAPADGRYVIQVRDVHQGGGLSHGYYLKVERAVPTFVMDLDTDKTILAPGLAGVIHARITRFGGFDGEVQLGIEGLPPGVKATCGKVLPGRTDGCIILEAPAGAKKGAANVRVFGTATAPGLDGKPAALRVEARPLQEFYNPGGGRNHFPVSMHTVSVGDTLNLLEVKISPAAVTLKPGESKKVEVTVKRREGFKGNLTLDVVYQHLDFPYNNSLPAGVTVDGGASQTLLTNDQVKGSITLKAAADAKPVEKQQVAVMIHESINFAIKFTYSGEPLLVTVTK